MFPAPLQAYVRMTSYSLRYKHIPITINSKYSEIPWGDAGCQAALEGTCQEKTRRDWTKTQENILAHGKKICSVGTQ